MKNWKLWLVISLLFIGAGVTFFILWYKEKKKQNALTQRLATLPKTKPATAIEAGASVTPPTEIVETQVGSTERSVIQETPAFFGTRS